MATSRVQLVRRLALCGAVLIGFAAANVTAEALYTYRNESGELVFSDRPPDDGQTFAQQARATSSNEPPVVTIRVDQVRGGFELWAVNDCHCPAEVVLKLSDARAFEAIPAAGVLGMVPARDSKKLMDLRAPSAAGLAPGFEFGFVFGDPQAQHSPADGYRLPFAAGQRFMVSQAFPDAVTHVTPESQYAIDIVMPEQTAIYAARGGIVVEVAHSNFRGGEDWGKYGAKANVVKIMHADGSFALYAHLSWDSIRVRTGQRVRRGEFIAASGNTGFSTGPHLHFVVIRNAGLRSLSVPVVFSDGRGGLISPQSRQFIQNP